MSVPSYGDLGKTARDVFRTSFAYDLFKMKLLAPPADLSGEVAGKIDLKSLEGAGSILGRYKKEGFGKFSLKISTAGPIVGEYSTDGIIGDNVDFDAGISYNMSDSFQSSSLKAKYHNSTIHAQAALTKDFDRSVDLVGSVVLRMQNFLLGFQSGYDTNTSRITKKDVAIAIDHGATAIHFRCVQVPKEFGLSAFHRVNDAVDVAVDAKIAGVNEQNLWYFGAAMRCKLDDQCKLRLKFDKNLQLGTSLQLKLQESMLLTLAFNLDLTNPTSGQHKVGLGLDIQA